MARSTGEHVVDNRLEDAPHQSRVPRVLVEGAVQIPKVFVLLRLQQFHHFLGGPNRFDVNFPTITGGTGLGVEGYAVTTRCEDIGEFAVLDELSNKMH